jgi:hypothetical protein
MTAKKKTTTKDGRKGAGGSKGKRGTTVGVQAAGEPRVDLAELISAVLTHPDVPADLYNTIHDVIHDMPKEFMDTPAFVREQLRAHGVPIADPESSAKKEKAEGLGDAEQQLFPETKLTPAQAAAIVGSWDTNGDEHTGDLLLLCRALVYSDRRHAEDLLIAIEREKVLISSSVNDALDSLIEQRLAAWSKEVPR